MRRNACEKGRREEDEAEEAGEREEEERGGGRRREEGGGGGREGRRKEGKSRKKKQNHHLRGEEKDAWQRRQRSALNSCVAKTPAQWFNKHKWHMGRWLVTKVAVRF